MILGVLIQPFRREIMSLVAHSPYRGDLREMGDIENEISRRDRLRFSICSETPVICPPGELIEEGGVSSNIPTEQGFRSWTASWECCCCSVLLS